MTTTVAVVIPWRDGCSFRRKALAWVMAKYVDTLDAPFEIALGDSPAGPFNRAAAILNGAARTTADVIVVSDGDVYCDPTAAVAAVASGQPWAIPHELVHRLSADSTEKALAGADWRGLPLSADNPQDRRPYRGNETGTLFVIRRDVLDDVPPDVRFVGWGHEDTAYAYALRILVGAPWRGSDDLVHLWHPPQERATRRLGNPASKQLEERYRAARRNPTLMRALVDEGKEAR